MPLDAIDELATGFEGCEKKVEIDFHLTNDEVDLRTIPRAALDSILDLAKCTIISVQRNADFDAYVLSESSLFIYPSKVMLKTCGTTLLLKCVSALLSAARSLGALPDFLQFSRSNFLFPSKQHFPHRAFNEETDYLNEQLGIKGDAFILGSLNGARWHLYIWDFNEVQASEYQQQTLEVIMFNLNTEKMKTFYKLTDDSSSSSSSSSTSHPGVGHPCRDGEEATRVSGIDQLLPGSVIDSHLFTPCGYSCNGRVDVKDIQAMVKALQPDKSLEERKEATSRVGKQGKYQQAYFTIHITPEPECSFVSFETNAVLPSYTALVRQVVDTFQPGSFCVSLFVDGGSDVSDSRAGLSWDHPGYVTKGTTHHAFQAGYNATVSQFEAVSPHHLAPQFGAHALNNEPTNAEQMHTPVIEGKKVGDSATLAGIVMPFSSPRSSPLSAHLVLSGLNGLPSSYETVTSLSQEQMRAVVLEIAKQKRIEVQQVTPSLPAFTLNGEADGVSVSALSSPSPLTAAAQSFLSLSPDVGFTVVDLGALSRRFYQWSQLFPRVEPIYTMDSTSLPSGIAVALSALGCHFSVHSASALQQLLSLSIPASRLIFRLPLKSHHQLRYAHSQHVDYVTASSDAELHSIAQVHDSAKVLLHIVAGEGIGFTESEVIDALAVAKKLDLTIAGIHLSGDSIPNLVKIATRLLSSASAVSEKLQIVHLDGLPVASFTDASSASLPTLFESLGNDVRVMADSRAFFDVDLALTVIKVVGEGNGKRKVKYVHQSVEGALRGKKQRVERWGGVGEGKEAEEVRVVNGEGEGVEVAGGVGDWLHFTPSTAQLEQLSAAGIDALQCHYIAS